MQQLTKVTLTIMIYAISIISPINVNSGDLNLSQEPLLLSNSYPPLILMVLGRDHKLYYEAYNDASDLDGDGHIDYTYKPSIDYYGYFDSYKCYTYHNSHKRFKPSHFTTNKKCSGSFWSGDFLNYLTTSRLDALRGVLYGGMRYVDANDTILERANIPQDAHSWGKEYTSVSVNGYDIRDYTPYSLPSNGKRHLFANTTLQKDSQQKPLLRVASNVPYRVWEWLSIERPVAGDRVIHGGNGPKINSSTTDYIVRLDRCVPGLLESDCKAYPNGKHKPTGILQEFGENNQMKFGLLTGSYVKNLSGGVLRDNVDYIDDEIKDTNGGFQPSVKGIIHTINHLKITGFNSSYTHNSNCGFIFKRDMYNGECRAWGNPIAEMMYEGVRYFAGKTNPTPTYYTTGGEDNQLDLPAAQWKNPYDPIRNPWCAKPFMLVISDTYNSYDTDQIPGSHFSSFSGDLSPSLQSASLAQTIWNEETGGGNRLHFIGQSGSNNDGTPSPKWVNSFGNIRGLAPEEPNKKGGYYPASVAYYGKKNDVNPVQGDQNIDTFAVTLTSPIPTIKIPMQNGKTIELLPFGKSVGPKPPSCIGGIESEKGKFQPTNTIVDFYVESLSPTEGTFRVNFEDAQQGADHDMDAIVKYHYKVNNDNTVTIDVDSTYAAGCIIQHMGYVISGTTKDGTYLEVRDKDTAAHNDIDYFLDTPPGEDPNNNNWDNNTALPLSTSRTFTPSNAPTATVLPPPLFYAAKWGGFIDSNNNNKPDLTAEFDKDNDGIPDTYFPITNPLKMKTQLTKTFKEILARTASSTAVSFNETSLSLNTKLFFTSYQSGTWTSTIAAFALDPNTGDIIGDPANPATGVWEGNEELEKLNYNTERHLITYKPSNKKGVAFRWPVNPATPSNTELDVVQTNFLKFNPKTQQLDTNTIGRDRLNFIRGERANEKANGGEFRSREKLLGDIVHSTVLYYSAPLQKYTDYWPAGSPENAKPYSAFKANWQNRQPYVIVGGNDGMVHFFNADTGKEKMSFIPSSVMKYLSELTDEGYAHRYFVDGDITLKDVFYNNKWRSILVGGLRSGGQGIYALDVTNPNRFKESKAKNVVRWEFTDSDDMDLGYTYGTPQIARFADTQWGVIIGNGYNSSENDGNTNGKGNAVIYILDAKKGNIIKKFDTKVGKTEDPTGQSRPNGISTPLVVDVDGNQVADYVYAGDLFGNLWKIDVRSANPSNWKFSFVVGGKPKPLFVAKDANGKVQPITTRIEAIKMPNKLGQYMLAFGTGKLLEISDKTNTDVQSFYGIIDNNQIISSRTDLLEQTITYERTITDPNGDSFEYRTTSNHAMTTSHKGWYMDLVYNNSPEGERVVNNITIRNGRFIATTTIIDSTICSLAGGTGWLMELDIFSGSRLAEPPFDINLDSTFDTNDYVNNHNNNPVPPSGRKSTVGIPTMPTILDNGNVEYKYISGSSGTVEKIIENSSGSNGRTSWRELRRD